MAFTGTTNMYIIKTVLAGFDLSSLIAFILNLIALKIIIIIKSQLTLTWDLLRNLFAAYHLNAESVLGLLFLIARYVRPLSEEL